jgi:hypothetical protein
MARVDPGVALYAVYHPRFSGADAREMFAVALVDANREPGTLRLARWLARRAIAVAEEAGEEKAAPAVPEPDARGALFVLALAIALIDLDEASGQ